MSLRALVLPMALAAALMVPSVASAQDSYDDRWYITVGAGANFQDSSRGTDNAPVATLGLGKFVNPRWSIDAELNYQNPEFRGTNDLRWSQYGLSLDARRHFRHADRRWNPYLLAGVGYQRSDEQFDSFPSPVSPGHRKDGFASAKLGVGLQGDFQRVSLRAEVYGRTDFDRDSVNAGGDGRFTDAVAAVSLVVPLGQRAGQGPVAAAPLPMVVTAPAAPLTTRPPDPDPMMLDLPTVYFAFDRADLRSEGRAALDQAAATLRQNPSLHVEISGHTDDRGSVGYNQRLSERRAKAAYSYLIQQGVDASQLHGPVGYGELRPAESNAHADGSDNPAGRAKNRRAEIDAQP